MGEYFLREQGIGYRLGTEAEQVLKVIANRFMADNPPVPALYGLRSCQGFGISEDYMDEIKLHEKLLDMESEACVYAWAELTPPCAGPFHFRFGAYGPVTVYVNGEKAYCTTHVQERLSEEITDICLNLKEGKNQMLFECINTPLGCGFRIGSSSYKGRRIQFFAPDSDHKGMNGFVYSKPMKNKLASADQAGLLKWLPRLLWSGENKLKPASQRLFDGKPMVAVTKITCPIRGSYRFTGYGGQGTEFYLDGKKSGEFGESFDKTLRLEGGIHILAFWGQDVGLKVFDEAGEKLKLDCPVKLLEGRKLEWIYAGPFQEVKPDLEELLTFSKPFLTDEGRSFWRADLVSTFLRPFNEGVLYGEWNYPLGVTLYGLIRSARTLKDMSIDRYAEGHMKKCALFYDYCMWDKKAYGAAPFHNQLTTIDSLDDCGSFASALLEVMRDHEIPGGDELAQVTAHYMKGGQQRLKDGTFYRNNSYLPVMNETIWADDLYMSIPFLSRYYERTGNEEYLFDAIQQIKQFFKYLYMPELQVLSHIYDTRYEVQTKVPWGRGNGWALFSLTELLFVMPKDHEDWPIVLKIFQTLCEGYYKLQDASGMWHQVLTMTDSYPETSCTAMFICGFARGVRYGWLENASSYAKAAMKGWQALCEQVIDWKGNIYGVCRGSGYSFSKEYYARDLGWNFNDTHGTGIVLLAGIEVEKMQEKTS